MDQQFKKIIQKTKAWKEGKDPLAHTFEGALFNDSSWAFAFDDSVTVSAAAKKVPTAAKEAPVDPVKSDSLSLVLFVGDTYVEGEDLLGKMIQAMKLRPGEYNRVAFDEKMEEVSDLSQNLVEPSKETRELLTQIKQFKPQVVVSLGATVTNILLGKRDKLSGIHGQFFDKDVKLGDDSYTYKLMPIFHPEFLVINPNMKRTAWIDLQKVMELIGKI